MYQESVNSYFGLVVFAVFVLFTFTALILGSIPDWWPWARNKLYCFWKSLWDFGFEDTGPYDQYGQYRGDNYSNKPLPHVHSWAYYTTTKHNWRIVDGKPIGMWNPIDKVIQEVRNRPGHTETKLETLLGWKASGYNIVHTSWNHWCCKVCGVTKQTEYYCAPSKADGTMHLLTARDIGTDITPPTYSNTDNERWKKKQTTQITTWRREIPVEKMKKYGVTI